MHQLFSVCQYHFYKLGTCYIDTNVLIWGLDVILPHYYQVYSKFIQEHKTFLGRCLKAHLAYGSVFVLSVARRPVPRQLHGQAEINDDTRAVRFDQNVATVQVSVGNRRLVQV